MRKPNSLSTTYSKDSRQYDIRGHRPQKLLAIIFVVFQIKYTKKYWRKCKVHPPWAQGFWVHKPMWYLFCTIDILANMIFVFSDLKNTRKIIFAVYFYILRMKNSWRRCKLLLSWALGTLGTLANTIFVFSDLKNLWKIILAVFYIVHIKNSWRRCKRLPSWAPGTLGTLANTIFVISDLKNPWKIIFAVFYIVRMKNSWRRCKLLPSWAPGTLGTLANTIFVLRDL